MIFGRFAILCAILRQLHLIFSISFASHELSDLSPDIFFIDQLSAGLPLLRLLESAPIFFYCHFPDLLLARGRTSFLKRAYRLPFDLLEQWSMTMALAIAVNSSFTRSVVVQTWPGLARNRNLKVVHPAIDTSIRPESDDPPLQWPAPILLSINRFERKKDIALALRAFAHLPVPRRATLVVAGGYDNRVAENVEYHAELAELADELGLKHATASTVVTALSHATESLDVLFLLSVPGRLKEMLLRAAHLLVYTPSGEHFGIVPLEAMLRGVPVLAANNGGPTETVVDGETGWLRDPSKVEEWSVVMDRVLNSLPEKERVEMGRKGCDRVKERFAVEQMAGTLDGIFDEMLTGRMKSNGGLLGDILLGGFALAAIVGLISTVIGLAKTLQDLQPGKD